MRLSQLIVVFSILAGTALGQQHVVRNTLHPLA